MKTFIIKVSLFIAVVLLLNQGFDWWYRQKYNLPFTAGIVWRKAPTVEPPYKFVAVGSSHIQQAALFKGFKLPSLKLTNVAQRFTYDLLLLKQHSNQIDKGAVILISVTPISFSHSSVYEDSPSSRGTQGMYYGSLQPWFIPQLDFDNYLQSKVLPSLRSGYSLRRLYADEVRARIAEEEKDPDLKRRDAEAAAPATHPVEQPIDTSLDVALIQQDLANPNPIFPKRIQDDMNFIFNKWYNTDEFNPNYFEVNRRELENLIQYTLQQGWQPVLITVPISTYLQEGLLDDYMQTYMYDNLAKTDIQGVEYLDFTQSPIASNSAFYHDSDHLSDRGAEVFSYELLQELIRRGYLTQEVDGYDYTNIK